MTELHRVCVIYSSRYEQKENDLYGLCAGNRCISLFVPAINCKWRYFEFTKNDRSP